MNKCFYFKTTSIISNKVNITCIKFNLGCFINNIFFCCLPKWPTLDSRKLTAQLSCSGDVGLNLGNLVVLCGLNRGCLENPFNSWFLLVNLSKKLNIGINHTKTPIEDQIKQKLIQSSNSKCQHTFSLKMFTLHSVNYPI